MNVTDKAKFISNWIKDYASSMPSKAETLVIGISGGIDSSVSSTLSAMTGLRTIVLSMPIKQKSNQHDLSLKHQKWLLENFENVEASTFSKFSNNHFWCFKLKSCWFDFCLIGIERTIVLKPVMALKVLETDESMPPEIPITKVSAFDGILDA